MSLPHEYSTVLMFSDRYKDLGMNEFGNPAYIKQMCDGWPATCDLGWSQFKEKNRQCSTMQPPPRDEDPAQSCCYIKNEKKCPMIAKIVYIILNIVTFASGCVLMILAIGGSVIYHHYATAEAGRAPGMLVLAFTAGLTLCLTGYAIFVVTCTNQHRPLWVVAIILVIVILLHVILGLTIVKLTKVGEDELNTSLHNSFLLAKTWNPDAHKLWAVTQYDLKCCGFNGPEDYRIHNKYPPEIPITCCPTCDPDSSEKSQESVRQVCKQQESYYTTGCKYTVTSLFQSASGLLMLMLIVTGSLELLVALISLFLGKSWKKHKHEETKNEKDLRPS